jgi:DNA recombination protein RmuC
MDIAYFWGPVVLAVMLAGGFGFLLGRYTRSANGGIDPAALATSQAEVASLKSEGARLRVNIEQVSLELKSTANKGNEAREANAGLNERVANLTRLLADQTNLAQRAEQQRKIDQEREMQLGSEIARLKERERSLESKLSEQAWQLSDQQKKLTTEFENIANRILKTTSAELSAGSQKTLGGILDPLRDRIAEFQQKVEKTYDAETRDVLSLKAEIKLMAETSHAIGNQADGLAKALRNDSQQLGRWGELALERILVAAGLEEGREFITQGSGLGLKGEGGGIQKPDVVVRLPEDRTLVIDSKVPLTSYERLLAAKDEEQIAQCRSEFVSEVKGHINDLAGKRYQENEKLQAHDCVLMFVPIEGALAAALAGDPDLFIYGWDRRVVLVGPPTLLMTMRTVGSIWRYEHQGQNAQEIARLAGALCDKVTLSVSDFCSVGDKISAALETHNDAVKRLSSGKGNALSIGQRIVDLGVKTTRPIPSLIDGISVAADEANDFVDDDVPANGAEKNSVS